MQRAIRIHSGSSSSSPCCVTSSSAYATLLPPAGSSAANIALLRTSAVPADKGWHTRHMFCQHEPYGVHCSWLQRLLPSDCSIACMGAYPACLHAPLCLWSMTAASQLCPYMSPPTSAGMPQDHVSQVRVWATAAHDACRCDAADDSRSHAGAACQRLRREGSQPLRRARHHDGHL